MADDVEQPLEEETSTFRRRSIRKTSINSFVVQRNAKIEKREKVKKISDILRKPECDRTATEKALVKKHPDIVKASQNNAKRLQATKDRVLEIEDEPEDLAKKCDELAELIRASSRIVVYTGAGISTAASIPDYRGPNGVWTLLQKGQQLSAQDLSDAEPTFTHMSITKLFRTGRVKHVVSQNCDGLHIRSGYPRYALSEVHGNMFIECCYNCDPHREYIRLFDVTEKTGVRRHTTNRKCRACSKYLTDTIVHFGEKGKIKSPYRWKEAVRAAKSSDLILCLGSSLKILRRYTCLWCMDKKPKERPKLVIVNLQWTPKDDVASLKINGRCDDVMKRVLEQLEYNVPEYRREFDPIFKFCTPLRANEKKTTSKKILVPPIMPSKASVKAAVAKSAKSKKRVKRSTHKTKSEASSCADIPTMSCSSSVKKDEGCCGGDIMECGMLVDDEKQSIAKVKEETVSVEGMTALKEIKQELIEPKIEENSNETILHVKKEWDVDETTCDDLQQKDDGSPVDNDHDVNTSSDNVSVDPSTISTTSVAHLSKSNNKNNVHESSTKIFLDQCSSDHADSSSSSLKKNSLCASEEEKKSCEFDSIGVLVVSQPPQCLTDVCSLDLNSENPSVFPVCRIELPAVDETVFDSRIDHKEENLPSRSIFEDEGNNVIEDDLGFNVSSEDIPSTVVVDLEMMEKTTPVKDDQDSTDIQTSKTGLYGISGMMPSKVDLQNWHNLHKTNVSATSSSSEVTDKTNNLIVDLEHCDINKPPKTTSCHHIVDSEPHIQSTQMQSVSYLSSGDLGSNLSKKWIVVPTVSRDLCQQEKSVLSLTFSTSEAQGSHDHNYISSVCVQPSQRPQNTQCLISSQTSNNSISVLPKSINKTPATAFSSSMTGPKSVKTCLSTNDTFPLLTQLCLSSVSGTKIKGLKALPQSLDEQRHNLPQKELTVTGASLQQPAIKDCIAISYSQVPSPYISTSAISSSSSSFTTECNISEGRSKASVIMDPSPFKFKNRLKPQLIPICAHNDSDLVFRNKKKQDMLLGIRDKSSKPFIPQNIKTSEGKVASSVLNVKEHDCLLIDDHCEKNIKSDNSTQLNSRITLNSSIQTGLQSSLNSPQVFHKIEEKNKLGKVNCFNGMTTPERKSEIRNENILGFYCATSSMKIISDSSKQYGSICFNNNDNNHLQKKNPFPIFSESRDIIQTTLDSNMHAHASFKSGITSYVLNMDDLLTPKTLSSDVLASKRLKLSENDILSNTCKELNQESASTSVSKHDFKNSLLLEAKAQKRAFSSESQTVSQATSLVSKSPSQYSCLEHSINLSENTDIPIKDHLISNDSAQTHLPYICDRSAEGNLEKLSFLESDIATRKSVQKASKRSHNHNHTSIVLKADWGTPLTTLLHQQDVVCGKTKTSNKPGRTKHSSLENEHPSTGLPPAPLLPSKLPSDFDSCAPKMKTAKKMVKSKVNKTSKKSKKPCRGVKQNKNIVMNKKKLDPVTPSLPGWFGKGLAIKRKRKS